MPPLLQTVDQKALTPKQKPGRECFLKRKKKMMALYAKKLFFNQLLSAKLQNTVNDEDDTEHDEEPIQHEPFAGDQHNADENGQTGKHDVRNALFPGLECVHQGSDTLERNQNAKHDQNDFHEKPTTQNDDGTDGNVHRGGNPVLIECIQYAENDEQHADNGQQPVQNACAEDAEEKSDDDVHQCGQKGRVYFFGFEICHKKKPLF